MLIIKNQYAVNLNKIVDFWCEDTPDGFSIKFYSDCYDEDGEQNYVKIVFIEEEYRDESFKKIIIDYKDGRRVCCLDPCCIG